MLKFLAKIFSHRHRWQVTHTNRWQIPTQYICSYGCRKSMEKSEGMLEFVWVIVDRDGVEVSRSKPFGIFDGRVNI